MVKDITIRRFFIKGAGCVLQDVATGREYKLDMGGEFRMTMDYNSAKELMINFMEDEDVLAFVALKLQGIKK